MDSSHDPYESQSLRRRQAQGWEVPAAKMILQYGSTASWSACLRGYFFLGGIGKLKPTFFFEFQCPLRWTRSGRSSRRFSGSSGLKCQVNSQSRLLIFNFVRGRNIPQTMKFFFSQKNVPKKRNSLDVVRRARSLVDDDIHCPIFGASWLSGSPTFRTSEFSLPLCSLGETYSALAPTNKFRDIHYDLHELKSFYSKDIRLDCLPGVATLGLDGTYRIPSAQGQALVLRGIFYSSSETSQYWRWCPGFLMIVQEIGFAGVE